MYDVDVGSRVEVRGQPVELVSFIHLYRGPRVELRLPGMLGKCLYQLR